MPCTNQQTPQPLQRQRRRKNGKLCTIDARKRSPRLRFSIVKIEEKNSDFIEKFRTVQLKHLIGISIRPLEFWYFHCLTTQNDKQIILHFRFTLYFIRIVKNYHNKRKWLKCILLTFLHRTEGPNKIKSTGCRVFINDSSPVAQVELSIKLTHISDGIMGQC